MRLAYLTMTSVLKRADEFLSESCQQVLLAVESLAADSPKSHGLAKLPTPEEIRERMHKLGLKKLGLSRIGQNLSTLDRKGKILRLIKIVKAA